MAKSLDPRVLNKISRLELRARTIVEGFVSGLHRSPYHGFSVEFAAHREYAPGDDLKHLDWKVFGRSDRLYLKQYEQETNLVAHFLLDTSESMAYTSGESSKLHYASLLTASLAYLVTRQQDAASLVLFDKNINKWIPPGSSQIHLRGIVSAIDTAVPHERTNIGHVLHEIAERLKKRGLVVLVSDLLDTPENVISGLQHFKHKGHDVLVFQVLDEYELSFPFQRMTLFEGIEDTRRELIEPRSLREAYLAEVASFTAKMKSQCLAQKIDFIQLSNDQPLDVALATFLAARLKRRVAQR
ncbi:MAG: DUF58 domain-containing protein [Planctomycetota bacterium]|nr:DUF58 domain-containing protein [Planctomycetota bacterium]